MVRATGGHAAETKTLPNAPKPMTLEVCTMQRRSPPAATAAQVPPHVPPHVPHQGQRVEVIRGELTGTRGVLVRTSEKGRWLVRLEGTVAGILVSMPRSGLRVVPVRRG